MTQTPLSFSNPGLIQEGSSPPIFHDLILWSACGCPDVALRCDGGGDGAQVAIGESGAALGGGIGAGRGWVEREGAGVAGSVWATGQGQTRQPGFQLSMQHPAQYIWPKGLLEISHVIGIDK